MQKGGNMQEVFTRFCTGLKQFEDAMMSKGIFGTCAHITNRGISSPIETFAVWGKAKESSIKGLGVSHIIAPSKHLPVKKTVWHGLLRWLSQCYNWWWCTLQAILSCGMNIWASYLPVPQTWAPVCELESMSSFQSCLRTPGSQISCWSFASRKEEQVCILYQLVLLFILTRANKRIKTCQALTVMQIWVLAACAGGVDTASTDGTFDISNLDRLGFSEVDLVQKVVDGVKLLIEVLINRYSKTTHQYMPLLCSHRWKRNWRQVRLSMTLSQSEVPKHGACATDRSSWFFLELNSTLFGQAYIYNIYIYRCIFPSLAYS